ncbi:signal peptidase II [Lachnospiraceae bacterium LCP25S3_G4]
MNNKKIIMKSYFYAIFAILMLVLLDQWSKFFAIIKLKDTSGIDVVDGIFKLYYLENRGAAFGMLQNQKTYFIISAIVILFVIGYFYGKIPVKKHYIPLRICAVFIVSGALGNMVDRIRLEYVVDFLYFELIDFPIFNVADIYVTMSTIILVYLMLFFYKEDELTFLTFKKSK